MDGLIDHALRLGLQISYGDLGWRTAHLHHDGLVVLNHRHHLHAQREGLAHEIGHWHYGHDWSRDHDRARDERQADKYAARLLIAPDDYRAAENLVGPHPGAVAEELGVTRHLVEVRRQDFETEAYAWMRR